MKTAIRSVLATLIALELVSHFELPHQAVRNTLESAMQRLSF
jgi:hypothetical protein